MGRKLYLFRHGETDALLAGIRYGDAANDHLTTRGFEQAQNLGQFLSNEPIDVIFSSPYERSFNTAHSVQKFHPDAGIITDERLVEGPFYFWGLDDADAAEHVRKTYERVSCAMTDILKTNFANIAISSHGGITRAILKFCGHEIGTIKPCECFILEQDNDKWNLIHNYRGT